METDMPCRDVHTAMIQEWPLKRARITMINHLKYERHYLPGEIWLVHPYTKTIKKTTNITRICHRKQRQEELIQLTSEGGRSNIVWRGPGFWWTIVGPGNGILGLPPLKPFFALHKLKVTENDTIIHKWIPYIITANPQEDHLEDFTGIFIVLIWRQTW